MDTETSGRATELTPRDKEIIAAGNPGEMPIGKSHCSLCVPSRFGSSLRSSTRSTENNSDDHASIWP